MKNHIDVNTENGKTELSTDEIEHIKAIFEKNVGLEDFLKISLAREVLDLEDDELGELIYYTSMTRDEEEDSYPTVFAAESAILSTVDAASKELLKKQIDEVLSTLTPREQRVLQLRFCLEDGQSRTLEEVGKEFNVTRERIRQIEAKALRKLRYPSRSRRLKDYLE